MIDHNVAVQAALTRQAHGPLLKSKRFEQRGYGRADRGEEQAHERRFVLGELCDGACEPEPSQRRSDDSGRRS